jgi:hypothetical protein
MILADDSGSSGGLGLLIVVAFLIVAAVLFVFMSRSMKRMRANVDHGRFGTPPPDGSEHPTPEPDPRDQPPPV